MKNEMKIIAWSIRTIRLIRRTYRFHLSSEPNFREIMRNFFKILQIHVRKLLFADFFLDEHWRIVFCLHLAAFEYSLHIRLFSRENPAISSSAFVWLEHRTSHSHGWSRHARSILCSIVHTFITLSYYITRCARAPLTHKYTQSLAQASCGIYGRLSMLARTCCCVLAAGIAIQSRSYTLATAHAGSCVYYICCA